MRKRGPHKAIGLYAHITWHTWRRQRTVGRGDVEVVVAAVRDAAARCRVRVHALAVLADHVHVLVSFSPDTTLTSFIRESKSSSALRINRGRTPGDEFRWCRGYYANSLSRDHVVATRSYIARQFHRHPDLVPV